MLFVVDRRHVGAVGALRRLVAIAALQLNRAVGAAQIFLKMDLVIEPDGAGIGGARAQHSKFGMARIEVANACGKFRRASSGLQVGVTLGAGAIAGIGKAKCTLMLDVAIGARWREGLIRMVNWAVMASEAGLIGGSLLEAGLPDVACIALLAEQGVRV